MTNSWLAIPTFTLGMVLLVGSATKRLASYSATASRAASAVLGDRFGPRVSAARGHAAEPRLEGSRNGRADRPSAMTSRTVASSQSLASHQEQLGPHARIVEVTAGLGAHAQHAPRQHGSAVHATRRWQGVLAYAAACLI